TTLDDLLGRAKRNYKSQKRVFPKAGSAEYQALLSQIVQYLVQVQEFDQKAADLHVSVTTKQVEDRLKQIKQQAFGGSEQKYSQDPGSKAQGGKLTISKGQTVPAFDLAAFTLPTHAISTPIHTTYGYHIIQPLSNVRPQKTTPLSAVKESIRQQLLQQKK